jgi:hypothetical protein
MNGGHTDAPDVAVALDALESDAVRWTDAATQLRAAAAAVVGQALPEGAFSFAGREAAAAYDGLRGRTAVLLQEGADNLDAVAAALRTSAAAYAASDRTGVRRLDAVPHRGPR